MIYFSLAFDNVDLYEVVKKYTFGIVDFLFAIINAGVIV